MPTPSKKNKARKATKTKKPIAAPRTATSAPRVETKSSVILKLLGRSSGATVQELAAATDWQQHSVRGFLSGALKRKRGLDVTSKVIDGIRRYHVDQAARGQ